MTAEGYPHGHAPELVMAFVETNVDPDTEWSLDGSDDRAVIAPSLKDDPRSGNGGRDHRAEEPARRRRSRC